MNQKTILADKRFKNSLAKAKEKFEQHFENATEVLMEFMTDDYITSRSPGLPYTSFLMRHFMNRALAIHGLKAKKPKRGFKSLMRVFDQIETPENIKRPEKKTLHSLIDDHAQKLILKPE